MIVVIAAPEKSQRLNKMLEMFRESHYLKYIMNKPKLSSFTIYIEDLDSD